MKSGSLTKRLAELERKAQPHGKFVVCSNMDDDYNEITGEVWERKLAAAREEAGPHGTVLILNYGGWPPEGRL